VTSAEQERRFAPAPPCLLVNPRSFRAARGLADRAIALAAERGAEVVRVEVGADLSAALDTILARRQHHVAVLAGDGTVREVIERLSQLPPGHWLPELLILPGGRTNLTAADLVPRADPLATLAKALAWSRDGRWDSHLVERMPLCIAQAPAPPRFGFFFGGAAVDSIVRRAQDHRYGGSGPLRRVLHPAGIIFKGSGFHNTDYKKAVPTSTNGEAKDGSKETAAGGEGSTSESGAKETSGSTDSSSASKDGPNISIRSTNRLSHGRFFSARQSLTLIEQNDAQS